MARLVRKPGGIGFDTLRIRIKELDKLRVIVGWLESARYDDGTPVAGVAAVHEFGSPIRNIPPRPFMRVAVNTNTNEWKKILESGAKGILKGTHTAYQVAELLGLKVTADIKKAIVSVTEPALAKSTIAAKRRKLADQKTVGSLDKPLVETGTMINAVTHEVQ